MNTHRTTSILLLLLAVTGCSTSLVPPGQPKATIDIHSSNDLTITGLAVDDRSLGLFANSVDVPVGERRVRADYSLEQEDCRPGEYVCEVEHSQGTCEATVRTQSDRHYLVMVDAKYSLVSVRVSAKGYFDLNERADEPHVGEGSCRESAQYTSYRRRS